MSSFLPSANRSLLLKAYTSIGEMDSLYSVSSDPLGNAQTRLCTYMQEGEWHKAIGTLIDVVCLMITCNVSVFASS